VRLVIDSAETQIMLDRFSDGDPSNNDFFKTSE
jgi:hypothetical protein